MYSILLFLKTNKYMLADIKEVRNYPFHFNTFSFFLQKDHIKFKTEKNISKGILCIKMK